MTGDKSVVEPMEWLLAHSGDPMLEGADDEPSATLSLSSIPAANKGTLEF